MFRFVVVKLRDLDHWRRDAERWSAPTHGGSNGPDLTPETKDRDVTTVDKISVFWKTKADRKLDKPRRKQRKTTRTSLFNYGKTMTGFLVDYSSSVTS